RNKIYRIYFVGLFFGWLAQIFVADENENLNIPFTQSVLHKMCNTKCIFAEWLKLLIHFL
ncbi:MAG: hypothetical protein WAU21_15300, partial [Chitinophagales bacterium]